MCKQTERSLSERNAPVSPWASPCPLFNRVASSPRSMRHVFIVLFFGLEKKGNCGRRRGEKRGDPEIRQGLVAEEETMESDLISKVPIL